MADPLSITAGIIGVLTAAVQISSLLIEFTASCQNAPLQARIVLAEVSDIDRILSHLQSFLLGSEDIDRSRLALIQAKDLVAIMTDCVSTFSELQELFDGLNANAPGIFDRMKWVRSKSAISAIIERLQAHKASLSLMLHIFNGFVSINLHDSD